MIRAQVAMTAWIEAVGRLAAVRGEIAQACREAGAIRPR